MSCGFSWCAITGDVPPLASGAGDFATTIEKQLSDTPATETRNRKPLEEPASFGATWELRFGPKNSFRVFYDVNHREAADRQAS